MSCGFDGEFCHEQELLDEIEMLIEKQEELFDEIRMLRSHLFFRDGRCQIHLDDCGLTPSERRS